MTDQLIVERGGLEKKDKSELQAIVQALGGSATSRARKADLIDQILELSGAALPDGDGGARNEDAGTQTEDAGTQTEDAGAQTEERPVPRPRTPVPRRRKQPTTERRATPLVTPAAETPAQPRPTAPVATLPTAIVRPQGRGAAVGPSARPVVKRPRGSEAVRRQRATARGTRSDPTVSRSPTGKSR